MREHAELVARAARGDRAAQHDLYDLHVEEVYATCRAVAGSGRAAAERALDALRAAFTELHRDPASAPADPAGFGRWLRAHALPRLADHLDPNAARLLACGAPAPVELADHLDRGCFLCGAALEEGNAGPDAGRAAVERAEAALSAPAAPMRRRQRLALWAALAPSLPGRRRSEAVLERVAGKAAEPEEEEAGAAPPKAPLATRASREDAEDTLVPDDDRPGPAVEAGDRAGDGRGEAEDTVLPERGGAGGATADAPADDEAPPGAAPPAEGGSPDPAAIEPPEPRFAPPFAASPLAPAASPAADAPPGLEDLEPGGGTGQASPPLPDRREAPPSAPDPGAVRPFRRPPSPASRPPRHVAPTLLLYLLGAAVGIFAALTLLTLTFPRRAGEAEAPSTPAGTEAASPAFPAEPAPTAGTPDLAEREPPPGDARPVLPTQHRLVQLFAYSAQVDDDGFPQDVRPVVPGRALPRDRVLLFESTAARRGVRTIFAVDAKGLVRVLWPAEGAAPVAEPEGKRPLALGRRWSLLPLADLASPVRLVAVFTVEPVRPDEVVDRWRHGLVERDAVAEMLVRIAD